MSCILSGQYCCTIFTSKAINHLELRCCYSWFVFLRVTFDLEEPRKEKKNPIFSLRSAADSQKVTNSLTGIKQRETLNLI